MEERGDYSRKPVWGNSTEIMELLKYRLEEGRKKAAAAAAMAAVPDIASDLYQEDGGIAEGSG